MQPLLDSTDGDERIHALEIVSEVAMRVGRYDTAHAALRRARREAPQRVTLQVCEAMLALHELRLDRALPLFDHLVRHHPEHGRYYTTENDYAVALHLRGDLAAAEHWIRRGLSTWAGVVHAQCLSNLNLASIVGSAGRWDEAHAALQRALALAREHASPLFEGEAWHRLARLYLQAGRAPSARAALEEAFALLSAGGDALRLAQWRAQAAIVAVAEGDLAAAAQHQAQARALLGDAPGMLARLRVMRADVYLARASGEHARAAQQAQALAEASEARGLDELRVESLLLQASVEAACPALRPGRPGAAELARRAQALAAQRGMLEWQWRAAELCGHLEPGAQAQAACRPLRERLFACVTVVADAEAALQLLPGLPHPRGD
jgi:tetratricopeptide (TPR) repeat protein